jgi:hypothetical protein
MVISNARKIGKCEGQTKAARDDCEGDKSDAYVSYSSPERRLMDLIRWYSSRSKLIRTAQNS